MQHVCPEKSAQVVCNIFPTASNIDMQSIRWPETDDSGDDDGSGDDEEGFFDALVQAEAVAEDRAAAAQAVVAPGVGRRQRGPPSCLLTKSSGLSATLTRSPSSVRPSTRSSAGSSSCTGST